MLKNEPYQSVLSEHKALEEHAISLETMNDEKSCLEMMNQYYLTLIIIEKEVCHERETCECDELMDECHKMAKEMQHLVKTHN